MGATVAFTDLGGSTSAVRDTTISEGTDWRRKARREINDHVFTARDSRTNASTVRRWLVVPFTDAESPHLILQGRTLQTKAFGRSTVPRDLP